MLLAANLMVILFFIPVMLGVGLVFALALIVHCKALGA